MTNPTFELYICFINFITGMFIFTIYYGVLIIEEKRNKYIVYALDILSITMIGILYLFILTNNTITFHIYNIIFISIGYIVALKFLNKQLKQSYLIFFKIMKYLYYKFKIIIKWCFDIIILNVIIRKIKKLLLKRKFKKTILKFNNKIKKRLN